MPSRPPIHNPPRVMAPRHQPKGTDRQKTRALNTNSVAWKAIRQQVLLRDGYRCQACGRLVTGREAHVDHIGNDAHDHESNRLENLQCLCIQCHGSKSRCEMGGKQWDGKCIDDRGCGLDGWPRARADSA